MVTPAQRERLTFLIEECSEVIQIASKILVHGYDSYHPDDPSVTNTVLLSGEIWDVEALIGKIRELDGVSPRNEAAIDAAWQKKLRRAQHQ